MKAAYLIPALSSLAAHALTLNDSSFVARLV
jgi:hypothetical protein